MRARAALVYMCMLHPGVKIMHMRPACITLKPSVPLACVFVLRVHSLRPEGLQLAPLP